MGHDLPSIAATCTKASRQKVGRTEKKGKKKERKKRKKTGIQGRIVVAELSHYADRSFSALSFSVTCPYLSKKYSNVFLIVDQ